MRGTKIPQQTIVVDARNIRDRDCPKCDFTDLLSLSGALSSVFASPGARARVSQHRGSPDDRPRHKQTLLTAKNPAQSAALTDVSL